MYNTRQEFNKGLSGILSAVQQEEYHQVTTMHKEGKLPQKLAEITRMVDLTTGQLEQLKEIYNEYALKTDSAIYHVPDKEVAARLLRDTRQEFNEKLTKLLTNEQEEEYLRVTRQHKEEKLPLKILEITRMVNLDDSQLNALKNLYKVYSAAMDSAFYHVEDQMETSRLSYEARKNFNMAFMDLLSNLQKREYVRASSHTEVMEKTEAKIEVLRRTGKYSDS
ncbi:MAG: hypothetical protein LUG18_09970 [Candidatus Azobacteroides sp.]|nr:hypothetical protein [Candidatus Azobacteroides sp.]